MKRIVSLILALTMVFALLSLTSCGSTPAAVVEDAFEKTENLNSYHVVMDVSVNMGSSGITMELPMTFEYKIENANGANPTVYVKSNVEMFGESIAAETYLKDGWAYMIQGNEKFKINLNKIENDDEYEYEFIGEFMQEIPEELLRNVKFTSEADGGKTVSVNIPDSTFNKIYDDFLKVITETALQEEIKNLVFSDATLSVTVNGGYVSVYAMEYTMSFNSESVPLSAGVKASLEYKNPGEKVTVTMPDGYESFKDVTSFMD